MSVLFVLFQALSCLGWGRLLIRSTRLSDSLRESEIWAWYFALGLGILGWLNFWLAHAGQVSPAAFATILALGLLGLLTRPRPALRFSLHGWQWVLFAFIATAICLDLSEALAPPADADTLAYHFARVKQVLESGQLIPVSRAVDGATPLLIQMSYLSILALGGEQALTLWTGLSGWLGLWPLYALSRRWLPSHWAAACVAVVATVPAWVYGAGSGQAEARLATFTLPALIAMAAALQRQGLAWSVVGGLLVGFFAGSKFFGLPFAALCAGALLIRGQWCAAFCFSTATAIAGSQWYLWHWVELGDPLFPLLWPWLQSLHWDDVHAQTLRELYFSSETSVSTSLFWAVAYPWVATLAPFPGWEASRTGLGPFGILIFPFAFAGCWRFRNRITAHPLFWVSLLTLAFYMLWFLSGTSQRIRHMLPLFPAFVLCTTVAAYKWSSQRANRRPLAAIIALTLGIQLAGQTLFSAAYIEHAIRPESREAFLERTVINYAPVPWINQHLEHNSRILLNERQLLYPLDRPYFFGHEYFQAQINLLPGAETAVNDRLTELAQLNITHILYESKTINVLSRLVIKLAENGCLQPVMDFQGRTFHSRTLGLGYNETSLSLVRINFQCGENSGRVTIPQLKP